MVRLSRSWLGYGLIIAAVWAGWEMIKLPVSERAPPAVALRIAPTSPGTLARAAESELLADRNANARHLAEDSLVRAPFNVRALRVLGLTEARAGRDQAADNLLTLAGNWSLRDDPSHAWLVERRLRQGSYGSAFAHADALARRRPGSAEPIFDLFATAAIADSRALSALVELFALQPPWRQVFLTYLIERPDTDDVLLSMAVALDRADKPMTDGEIQQLYQNWFAERRISAMLILRDRIGRPVDRPLQNGDFGTPEDQQILPFGWRIAALSGGAVSRIEDDLDQENFAIRAEHNGREAGVLMEQAMFLAPGRYVLRGRSRVESAAETGARQIWRAVCLESGAVIGEVRPGEENTEAWTSFSAAFTVPAVGCTVQLLNLFAPPDPRRRHEVVWHDDIAVQLAQPSA